VKPYMGSRGIAPLILNPALYGGERFKFTSSAPSLYTREKVNMKLGGPYSLSKRF